jgi:hypothetical protein
MQRTRQITHDKHRALAVENGMSSVAQTSLPPHRFNHTSWPPGIGFSYNKKGATDKSFIGPPQVPLS